MIESCESKDDFLKDILKEIIWIIKMCFFWGGNLPFLLGWPLTRLSVFLFSPPAKKKWVEDESLIFGLRKSSVNFVPPCHFGFLMPVWPSSFELSAYFLHTSYPFLDKFTECCAFGLEKTSQLWRQAYREKDRGEMWLGGRGREKEGRALGMTKSGCFCCDIAFNI